MRKFVLEDREFKYHGPRSVIEKLRSMQGQDMSYEEFFKILKRRLRMWTGKEEVAFYNEDQVVDLLQELNEVTIFD
ncbi:hypothetical protein [Bacillus marasmi]|uniref:hypothetical protein n=1 Tax=Bacillus marasmi TaxID=1926279 RepID=UPI0011C844A3|nr:hypothetical protein [Bacillus marasmi]